MAFLKAESTNAQIREKTMAATSLVEFIAVANDHGFDFYPADMVRFLASSILSLTDTELAFCSRSPQWWRLWNQIHAFKEEGFQTLSPNRSVV